MLSPMGERFETRTEHTVTPMKQQQRTFLASKVSLMLTISTEFVGGGKIRLRLTKLNWFLGATGHVVSDERTFWDANTAHSDANDGPNMHMRRTLYNITFDVILYSYIVQ